MTEENVIPPIKHTPINVSPFSVNVLDLVGREGLVTPKGTIVKVGRSGNNFVVNLENTDKDKATWTFETNIEASAFLNAIEVGTK